MGTKEFLNAAMPLLIKGLSEKRGGKMSQGWAARFRRLARDYEQLAEPLKGLHVVAFAMLMLKQLTTLIR
jgi:hypothetical protein